MAWSTNNSANLTVDPNSTMAICVPCVYSIPAATALICNSLFGLFLKSWTLWLLASPPITKKTDLSSCNMLITDLIVDLANLLAMSGIFLFHQFSQYTWSFLFCLVAFGRPLFQCLICVERYLAVEHPIVFLMYRPLRYRVAILASAWISVFITCSVAIALCVIQKDYVAQFLLFQCTIFLLIFVINSLCCASILRALIRPPPGDGRGERGRNAREGRQINKESLNYLMKKKAFIMVVMIQVYGVICYLPAVALVFRDHGLEVAHFCAVYMFNLWYVLLSSTTYCFYHLHNLGKLKWMNCLRKR